MRATILFSAILLSGCASVSFKQLSPADLALKAGAPEGAVYYLPKPYLLVARLPKEAAAAPAAPQPAAIKPPKPGAQPGANPAVPAGYGGADGDAKEEKKEAAKPDVGASDLSFGAATGDYIVKLIYLPDRSRPMNMSVNAGLFGTGTLKPTLQNGWMLTSFEASADNSKFAEVLGAVASIITAQKGGGAGEEASGGGVRAAAAGVSEVLRPGVYDFDYDAAGRLTKLCAVSYFTDQGIAKGDC